MDEYTRGFEALKGMRTLRWKPHLGLVEVEVELADRTLSFSVTPAQATAIMHFQEKGMFHGIALYIATLCAFELNTPKFVKPF